MKATYIMLEGLAADTADEIKRRLAALGHAAETYKMGHPRHEVNGRMPLSHVATLAPVAVATEVCDALGLRAPWRSALMVEAHGPARRVLEVDASPGEEFDLQETREATVARLVVEAAQFVDDLTARILKDAAAHPELY